MSDVGGYQLIESIGQGALGEAFRARDTVHGRTVVVKRVPASLAADEEWLAHLHDTGTAVAAVSHPGVAMLYECGVHEGETFLAQEFVPGQSLAQLLAGRPLHPRRALDIAVDIADGLAALHASGLTHGDLRPATTMVTPRGHVKLLDAGLSAFTGGGHLRRLAATDPDSIPASGTGVVRYLSPEQALREKGDARSDLFALGLVLYEMLTGQPAFDRTTPGQTTLAIVRDQPGRPSARQANVPPEIDAIVTRLLAKPVDRRYQSASAVSDSLRAIKPLFEEDPDELPALDTESGGRAKLWLWGLLAAAVAGAATWLLLRPGS